MDDPRRCGNIFTLFFSLFLKYLWLTPSRTRTRAMSTSKMVHWKLSISVEILLASLLLRSAPLSKHLSWTLYLNFILTAILYNIAFTFGLSMLLPVSCQLTYSATVSCISGIFSQIFPESNQIFLMQLILLITYSDFSLGS